MELVEEIAREFYRHYPSKHEAVEVIDKDEIRELRKLLETGPEHRRYILSGRKGRLKLSRGYWVVMGQCPFDELPQSIKQRFFFEANGYLTILKTGNRLFDHEIVDRYFDYQSLRCYSISGEHYFSKDLLLCEEILKKYRFVEKMFLARQRAEEKEGMFEYIAQYLHNRTRALNGLGQRKLKTKPVEISDKLADDLRYRQKANLAYGNYHWLLDVANCPFYDLPSFLRDFFLSLAQETYPLYSSPVSLPLDQVGEGFYRVYSQNSPDAKGEAKPFQKLTNSEKNTHMMMYRYCLEAYEDYTCDIDSGLIEQLAAASYVKPAAYADGIYVTITDINCLARLKHINRNLPSNFRFNQTKGVYEFDASKVDYIDLPEEEKRRERARVRDVIEILEDGVKHSEEEIGEILLQKERRRYYYVYSHSRFPESFKEQSVIWSGMGKRILDDYHRIKELYEMCEVAGGV